MVEMKPFRATRFDSERVELKKVFGEANHGWAAKHLYAPTLPSINNETEEFRRTRVLNRTKAFLAAWTRAGILEVDQHDSFTLVRVHENERLIFEGVFCMYAREHDQVSLSAVCSRGESGALLATAECVSFVDEERDVQRAFESEFEREADCHFSISTRLYEAWIVDDETTCARIRARMDTCPTQIISRVGNDDEQEPSERLFRLGLFACDQFWEQIFTPQIYGTNSLKADELASLRTVLENRFITQPTPPSSGRFAVYQTKDFEPLYLTGCQRAEEEFADTLVRVFKSNVSDAESGERSAFTTSLTLPQVELSKVSQNELETFARVDEFIIPKGLVFVPAAKLSQKETQ